jgi:hypothetical protein
MSITGFIEDLLTSVRFSSQHGIFLISVLNLRVLKLGNDFSYRPYEFPACMCVTGLTDTPTYGNGVPKSEISKNGIFHDRTISFIKIWGIALKQKWGGIENTALPQPNVKKH